MACFKLCYKTLRFFNQLTINFFENFTFFQRDLYFLKFYHLYTIFMTFLIYPMPSILLVMERDSIF